MNVGSGPFTPTQQHGMRRCARCGREFRGRGAGDGMCSDRCFVASRGRQASQGETLGRAFGEAQLRAERRALGNYRVTRMLKDAATENDVAAYSRNRRETLEVIERLEGRARGDRTITRSAGAPHCAHCAKIGATAGESAAIHASAARSGVNLGEVTRVTEGGGMGQLGTVYGEIVR